jgi:puromycin-sensitive aminopeptidase
VFSLVAAGQLSSLQGLRLLQAYQAETNYVVWNKISDLLTTLRSLLVDQPCFPQFNQFVCQLFHQIRASFVWEKEDGESHLHTLLRSLVISWLGRAGDSRVLAEAKRRFDLHASGEQALDADVR